MSTEPGKQLEGLAVGGHGGLAIIPGPVPGRIQKKINKQDEVDFYNSLDVKFTGDRRQFFPAYFGTNHVEGQGNYFIMEDLTYQYETPCILDIKMGRTSVGEDADPNKREAMEQKDASTTTVSLGQRITGYRVYNTQTNSFLKVGKEVTKKIHDGDYVQNLRTFFHNGERFRTELVQYFLHELEKVHHFMNTNHTSRFYSSSLLFVYDAKNPQAHGRIKMIDFAHVFDIRDGGKDDGYLFGLERLIHFFRQMLQS